MRISAPWAIAAGVAATGVAVAVASLVRANQPGPVAARQLADHVEAGYADTDGAPPGSRLDHVVVNDLVSSMRSSITWGDDNLCFIRALRGVALLNQRLGAQGIEDANTSAIAVIKGPFPGNDWNFHAALSYRAEDGQVSVVDLLADSKPMTVDAWKAHWGVANQAVQYVSPYEQVDFLYSKSSAGHTVQLQELNRPQTREWFEQTLV